MTGFFLGIKPTRETEINIRELIKAIGLPNPTHKLHCTVVLDKAVRYDPQPISVPRNASFLRYDKFGSEKNCLVMVLSCPELEKRHIELRNRYGIRWDFPDYHPHITLSYDFVSDHQVLPEPNFPMVLQEEYLEDFNPGMRVHKDITKFLVLKGLSPVQISKKHGCTLPSIQKEFLLGMSLNKNPNKTTAVLETLIKIDQNLSAFSSITSKTRDQEHQTKVSGALIRQDFKRPYQLSEQERNLLNSCEKFKEFERRIGAPNSVHPCSVKEVMIDSDGVIHASCVATNLETGVQHRFSARLIDGQVT